MPTYCIVYTRLRCSTDLNEAKFGTDKCFLIVIYPALTLQCQPNEMVDKRAAHNRMMHMKKTGALHTATPRFQGFSRKRHRPFAQSITLAASGQGNCFNPRLTR